MKKEKMIGLLLVIALTLVGCQARSAAGDRNVSVPPTEGRARPTATPQAQETTEQSFVGEIKTPAPMRGEAYIVDRAVSDLAQRLGVSEDDVQVVSVEEVEWSDSSLGCPAEEMDYAQVITPGYEVTLQVDDDVYSYHSDEGLLMVLCGEDGTPEVLPIPIQPGEKIQDGSPWVPVD